MDEPDYYQAFLRQLAIVRDRVRGVVCGEATGLYLHGRPGTSKSHTICSTLDMLGANYRVANGHLTPMGLFDLLDENRDRITVLDDMASLFNQPIALQFLLAALGRQNVSQAIRYIRHKTANGERVVPFTGGIVALSNLPLSGHHHEILAALNDRIFVIEFEPSDEQICAVINELARQGIGGVDPQDARMVATFVITECKARGVRPSIRLFVDKALPDFRLHRAGQTESDWRDLVISNILQQLLEPQHPTRKPGRAEMTEAEQRIALEIALSHPTRPERVAAWKARTGKSQASLYRRIDELKQSGRL